MDEVRMVRDGYAEPATPTPEEFARKIAEVKALLAEPPRRTVPRPAPRLWWGMGGVAAAGAAAAVAVALVGGNTPAPAGPGGSGGPLTLDGRAAVLAAAEKAERQPAGRYWYADQIQGQAYVVRAETGTYAITGAHGESFGWWGVKSGMGEGYYARDLPARPVSARDAALWRKAGSPSSFRVWSGDAFRTYTTKATKWRSDGPEVGVDPRGGGRFLGDMSAEELQRLPADPGRLADRFLSRSQTDAAAGVRPRDGADPREAPQGDQAATGIMRVASLLGGAPVPPKVRAGLMRALAAQPGVQPIGRSTDPLGREGVALAAAERATTITGESGTAKDRQGTYRSRLVVVFDERTGALLSQQEELTRPGGPYAEMKPGFVINHQTVRAAGWTADKPVPPAALPFD
ncbi:CU044_5270 family protein [Spirillospora sp. NPDC127200]